MATQLSRSERRAVAGLKRLAKEWPDTLWLFSGNGTLHIMKKNDGGERAYLDGGVDEEYSVETIEIENDGGDW